MAMRGSLRSETVHTQAALRGEAPPTSIYATYADEEEGASTPPPSPQSAAMLAAMGVGGDDNVEEERDDYDNGSARTKAATKRTATSASDSDSDFLPGEKSSGKRKKRRLRQSSSPIPSTASRRKRRPREETKEEEKEEGEEEQEEDGEEEESEPVETRKFKTDKRGRAQQNWVDDGCVATFETRLRELTHSIDASVRDARVTFYNNPKQRRDDQEEEEEDEEELDDGGFHDDEETTISSSIIDDSIAVKPVYYSPRDVLVTDSGLSVPTYVYEHLFPHQKQCLDWLHHLHERNTGGILGDEMGLGKTVQIAAFLGAMYDAKRVRTVLLLCPASVLLQWVREFHKWYPWLRVVLLHASGTGGTRAGRSYLQLIDEVMEFSTLAHDDDDDDDNRTRGRGDGGVVISTYENVRQYQELFLDREWDYVVLDEGHRIRNPDAEITLVCKQLKTVHRVILTGTPIQNRLRELWSLFDFVYPGKLGTLPTFEDEFVLPIRTGGYANASKMQVVMAYKCALALKDIINPFMLRRTKKEIQHVTKMPEKMEHIIFCNLTTRQYDAYEAYLSSPEVAAVLKQEIRPFRAISILRHICNHPDLLTTVGDSNKSARGARAGGWGGGGGADPYRADLSKIARRPPGVEYGDPDGSGKMVVLQKILTMWKQQGHRVLLFTQTRKMLDILESYMASMGYIYCRLDGTTSVRERQSLLDAFNQEGSKIFIFLLTTRAGGIGVNLTGANRVVVFDPDWNPSTDLQARERSWRLGQTKQVTIYRLITSGTIEEKIYHRQIFKQYLTNKVLHDAKRKRCFNKHSLRDLFVLGDQNAISNGGSVETTDLFVDGNVADPGVKESEEGEVDESGDLVGDSAEEEAEAGENEDAGGGGDGGDNDDILRQLFTGDQIRGVFNHDVVESDGIQNQESDLIELESTKIAESALSALRASCALVRQQRESLYTPTWTGRSGAAGDPSQRASSSALSNGTGGPRFGNRVARGRTQGAGVVVNHGLSSRGGRGGGGSVPAACGSFNPFAQSATSSRDMLARMKERKNGISTSSSTSTSTSTSRRGMASSSSATAAATRPHLTSAGVMKADEIAKQLHAFLLLRSTSTTSARRTTPSSSSSSSSASLGVTTEELLDAFGAVVAPKDKLVFRNLLRDIAVCRGRKWVLKDEFLTGLH